MTMLRTLGNKKTVKVISLTIAAIFVLGVFGIALTQSGMSSVASAAATESAVGVVNYQLLMSQSPDMKNVQVTMQEAVKEAQTEFQSKSADMKDDEKQRYYAQLQERLANKERELIDPVQKKIDAAIEKVAKKKGLSVIVDKGIVVYGGVDITGEVGSAITGK
ncbi:MAG: OmpH family outer membrane protein [Acidaminococcaceae bacterium]